MGTTPPDDGTPSLVLRLLGPFEARLNGDPIVRLTARKGQWLLALLILRRPRPHPLGPVVPPLEPVAGREPWVGPPVERSWLAGTLWPDSSEQLAFASLRRCLTDLRSALGTEAMRLQAPSPRTMRLDLTGVDVDVAAFDAAIRRGDPASLEAAVSLYRGPLLEGCTEEWVLLEREERQQAYLGALATLAEHALRDGDHALAESYLRRVLSVDPLRESAQRDLMQALAAGGNYAAATFLYREFRLQLHRELHTEPAPETAALFRQIRTEARARAAREGAIGGASLPRVAADGTGEPALALAPSPRRLPRPLTGLVGRAEEVRAVEACLVTSRLVTLLGPGGVGKTRMALQVAEELADDHADGAYFVDLGTLSDAALVPRAVASALEVTEVRDQSLTAALATHLHPRQLLLILDNCEHLIGACAVLAEALLQQCPELRILATSREALGIPGETTWRVPPLSLPEPGVQVFRSSGVQATTDYRPPTTNGWPTVPTPEHPNTRTPEHPLMQSDAARLFVERAAMVVTGFTLTPENAPAVARVCRRLDGLPLAIELAAARLRALTVEQIAERLDDRFTLLARGGRTAAPRHQALRATLDWSYELLSEPEQSLLRRLSVFAGSFDLEAAEAVCSDFGFSLLDFGLGQEGTRNEEATVSQDRASPSEVPIQNPKSKIQNPEVLDLLTGLVEKSLVGVEWQAGRARYRLLETTREYARELLLARGEEEAARGRHLAYFAQWAEQTHRAMDGSEEGQRMERLQTSYDNLRAALEWGTGAAAGQTVRIETGLRLAGTLWRFWWMRGYWTEGRSWLSRALAARERSMADREPGAAAGRGTEPVTRPTRGFQQASALALGGAGILAGAIGEHAAAQSCLVESLALFEAIADPSGTAWALNHLGWAASRQGEPEMARQHHARSLEIRRAIGDRSGTASSLHNLGVVARDQGDYATARAFMEESLAINRELGYAGGVAWGLSSLAEVALAQREPAAATALYRESLVLFRDLGHQKAIMDCLVGLSQVILSQRPRAEETRRAARLWGAAVAMGRSFGEADPGAMPPDAELAQATLSPEAYEAAFQEGQAMSLPEAIACALEAASEPADAAPPPTE